MAYQGHGKLPVVRYSPAIGIDLSQRKSVSMGFAEQAFAIRLIVLNYSETFAVIDALEARYFVPVYFTRAGYIPFGYFG